MVTICLLYCSWPHDGFEMKPKPTVRNLCLPYNVSWFLKRSTNMDTSCKRSMLEHKQTDVPVSTIKRPFIARRDFLTAVLLKTRVLWLGGRMLLKRDGTRAETRFRLSPKRTNPFKSAGASVRSNADSRGVRISVSNAGYTTFRGSVSTGYPLH